MLLTSKYSLPDCPEHTLARPRLLSLLNGSHSDQLLLVTAPAGYGKTTLVSSWAAGQDNPVAWYSLDTSDNQPAQFCRYLVESVHRATGNGVPETHKLLAAQRNPDPSLVISQLLAELRGLPSELRIVLDDYHQIDNEVVHNTTRFLLRHAPAGIGVVLTSRSQPPLGLASLRVAGRLLELSSNDLALTTEEISQLLEQRLPFPLDSDRAEQLHQLSEGWPPAVQLFALSVRDRDEVDRYLSELERGHSHILDYLAEEVLERLEPQLRELLACTSILNRVNAQLAEQLSGLEGGQQLLEQVARRGLFLQAQDSSRRWFRYHPVFARFLQRQLTDPSRLQALHRTACDTWQQLEQPQEALHHALAAEDPTRLRQLLEAHGEQLLREGQARVVKNCLDWLGADELQQNPRFTLLAARMARDNFEHNRCEKLLAAAESWLQREDPGQWHEYEGAFAAARAQAAVARGRTLQAKEYAEEALQLLRDNQAGERIAALLVTGETNFCLGQLEKADAHMREVETLALAEQDYPSAAWAICQQTEIAIAQGLLKKATALQERAQLLIQEHHLSGQPISEFICRLRGHLEWERGDLDAAAACARLGMRINRKVGERWLLPEYTLLLKVAQARGEKEESLEWLARIDRLMTGERYHRDWVANADAARMRAWRALNNQEAIGAWLEQAEPVVDRPSNHFEQCHGRNHVRAMIELHRWSDAGRLLARLQQVAQDCGLVTDCLRNLVLEAHLLWLREQRDGSVKAIREALAIAVDRGFCASFLQIGKPLIVILKAALESEDEKGALSQAEADRARELIKLAQQQPELDGGIRIELDETIIKEILQSDAVPDFLRHSPLTPREWQVLNAIHSGLSNERIARHFKVAPSTIKTHIRSLYQKLDVKDRQEAIALAEQMLRSVQDKP
ncbi:HTH-type transcriptional regulator MalT [Microbulbifer thermotolerans]|uniref:HTH-type transcriptional regulator MalT n=1 Tax=Microbulbifer thermotolerans TaxID=252514 RepID=UPI0022487B73|nr:HTH-type transcriptional regulator MalT [Microbulbifer thermotolerans]MCX2781209.1 HTH-type transcriptional regulator MalT [Microbulbifer thermotolerans]MCX2803479.1 HTH-type transcriptional regulator MalT [Microbulbifer thermotolerans]MCX2832241.1 HTH-type transcriptional regulator MalT [Microbulbifer thermotolerans]